jgi:hypothetical protein
MLIVALLAQCWPIAAVAAVHEPRQDQEVAPPTRRPRPRGRGRFGSVPGIRGTSRGRRHLPRKADMCAGVVSRIPPIPDQRTDTVLG